MPKKALAFVMALSFVGGLLVMALQAEAATIRVRCEKRVDRSRISVDGNDLVPGNYSATVMSGLNEATAAPQATVGAGLDEVAFGFDSNAADIALGATEIPVNFIQGSVTGKILDASNATVISDTVTCK